MSTILENLKKPVVCNLKTSTGQYLLQKYGGKVKVKVKLKGKEVKD